MPKLLQHKTDGGRSWAINPQEGDCFIRALSILWALPYDLCASLALKNGFNNGMGPEFISEILGKRIDLPYPSYLDIWLTSHNKGNYLVLANEHVFAVLNGIIYDEIEIPNKTILYGYWII